MLLFPSTLASIMPRCPEPQLALYARELSDAMAEAEIWTHIRAAAFLGQLAHESGQLRFWVELADGKAYEGKERLGNTQPGDGPRFKGRSPIQLTGRRNYTLAGDALQLDLVNHPELAELPEHGFRIAAWFWRKGAGLNLSPEAKKRLGGGVDLNDVADRRDFLGITMAIQGAQLHHSERFEHYHRALEVLGAARLA